MNFFHAPGIMYRSSVPTAPISTLSLSDVAYGNGIFVATGNNKSYVSTDGVNWAGSYLLHNTGGGISGFIQYAPTAGVFRYLWGQWTGTSPDGVIWTSASTAIPLIGGSSTRARFGVSSDALQVAYPTYYWNSTNSTLTGYQYVTADGGTTWTAKVVTAGTWYATNYGNGKFISVASNDAGNQTVTRGIVATTATGTWTNNTSISKTSVYYDVAYGPTNTWVASGFNMVSVSTDNGVTWTNTTVTLAVAGLCYSSATGLWYAATYNGLTTGYIYTSPDGITWTQRATAYTKTANSIPRVAISDDGTVGVLVYALSTNNYTFTP